MKRKMYVLGVAALVAAMLALSGVAQSAMWVGAELGGNFPANTDIKADIGPFNGSLSGVGIRPSVIGGATISATRSTDPTTSKALTAVTETSPISR